METIIATSPFMLLWAKKVQFMDEKKNKKNSLKWLDCNG